MITKDIQNQIYLDTTVFLDFIMYGTRDLETCRRVSEFLNNLKEAKISLCVTTPILLEVVKNIKCLIYKESNFNRFKDKIRRLNCLLETFNINLLDLTMDSIKMITENMRYIFDDFCDCDVGELSLLIGSNFDHIIIVSSDNTCFDKIGVKSVDPRYYDGSDIVKWLDIEDLYSSFYSYK